MRHVPEAMLLAIQEHFHGVIRERAAGLTEQPELELPELASLLTSDDLKAWFPVPGMYGGFSYWFESDGDTATLITESWCRVIDGSGQRHEITAQGSQLVDEGFV